MPNRILREGILTSERIAKLTWPAEVFYRRLISVVDDFGRYYATPILLRSAAYPLQLDKVGNQDIGKWLTECVRAGLVRTYTLEGKDYLELLDFRQQQRARVSKFPAPVGQMRSTCVADAEQMPSTRVAHAHLDVVEDGDGDGNSVEPQSDSPLVVSLPLVGGTEAPITQAMVAEWEAAFPAVDVRQQLHAMRAWCIANPERRKTARGIARFVVRWLGDQQDKGRGGKPKTGLPSYT